MIARIPSWGIFWLVASSLVVCWDMGFVLSRPASFDSVLYKPYKLYITIDKVYGDLSSAWVVAQSLMNGVEVILNFLAVLQQVLGYKQAAATALVSLVCTFWKTIAYFAIEIVSGYANTQQASCFQFWALYVIPNGLWVIIPFILCIVLFNRIVASMGKIVKKKTR